MKRASLPSVFRSLFRSLLSLGALAGVLLIPLLPSSIARADKPETGKAASPAPATANAALPNLTGEVIGDIDLGSLVTSAAKGQSITVQEAPSIITIITAEEIRQRGYRELGQVIASIPGWSDVTGLGNQVSLTQVRGTIQAVLYLRDGVSFFDPQFNVATMSRAVPLETIKRIEVVTGPGGVLWGANSFLGVVNVITKDAEDVNGVEMSAGYGDGAGNKQDFRAYAMYGKSFFKDKLKLMLHASFESYGGEQFSSTSFVASSPTPQPWGPAYYSTNTINNDIARSWILNLDGKISVGPVSLYFSVPFGSLNHGLAFSQPIIATNINKVNGLPYPGSNQSLWNFYDRYAILEYKDRYSQNRFGLNAKGYYIQFNRQISPRVFGDFALLPGGLNFSVDDLLVQRFGGTLDVDYAGPFRWNRVLAGAEVFNERSSTSHATFPEPSMADGMGGFIATNDKLPIVCPLGADGHSFTQSCPVFASAAERTVLGLFLSDQIRPYSKLTLDGGVRYQQGFGQNRFDAQILGSAAAVWQFLPDFHLKLNFSQGFRPPVFNNTNGNGASLQFGGNPKLGVERSEAYQAELNARVWKNKQRIRELQLRLDYAYTILDNLIVVRSGVYQNSGKRSLHSIELLAKLFLAGDHLVTLGYTFLLGETSDNGALRASPRHMLTLGMVFNVVKERLTLNGNLTILGASNDPNRYPSLISSLPGSTDRYATANLSDFTNDRLTPVALLQLGARLKIYRGLSASTQFFNVLNQSYYYPDVFFDQAPIIEMRPTPAPRFSFFASLTYRPGDAR